LQGQQFATQTFSADPANFLTSAPIAVLVNRGTYGGPELAAAAIGDLKRGDVVGERTFGEGSFQKSIEMPDGADLLLTVAKFQSPPATRSRTMPSPPTSWWPRPTTNSTPALRLPRTTTCSTRRSICLKAKSA